MVSVILLLLLVASATIVIFYLFWASGLDPDSPTIAAMEAHAEAVEARRRAKLESSIGEVGQEIYKDASAEIPDEEEESDYSEQVEPEPPESYDEPDEPAPDEELPVIEISEYEYREMLDEAGGNYVLPQWIVNFFSSSDVCHTLDAEDNVTIMAKLSDPQSAEAGVVDISADCDMGTQTVTLKLCFGEGAAAESFRTKFYLFERGDLFELSRLVRQDDLRLDILTRSSDYTLEYVRTMRVGMPSTVQARLRTVLAKVDV
jgi:hypothetical protein